MAVQISMEVSPEPSAPVGAIAMFEGKSGVVVPSAGAFWLNPLPPSALYSLLP